MASAFFSASLPSFFTALASSSSSFSFFLSSFALLYSFVPGIIAAQRPVPMSSNSSSSSSLQGGGGGKTCGGRGGGCLKERRGNRRGIRLARSLPPRAKNRFFRQCGSVATQNALDVPLLWEARFPLYGVFFTVSSRRRALATPGRPATGRRTLDFRRAGWTA